MSLLEKFDTLQTEIEKEKGLFLNEAQKTQESILELSSSTLAQCEKVTKQLALFRFFAYF